MPFSEEQFYIRKLMSYSLLQRDEEKRLFSRKDEKSIQRIVESHARMVIKIASHYRKYNLPLSDLLQEGMIGLMKAAKKFDASYDVRFSTYARWWIKAFIQEYILRNWSIVRCSSYHKRVLFSRLRSNRAFIASYNKDNKDFVEEPISIQYDISLDQSYYGEGSISFQETIVDSEANPEEEVILINLNMAQTDWIRGAFKSLTFNEQLILRKRYLEDPAKNCFDIGREINISNLRVRQIEHRALRKLYAYFKNNRVSF